MSGLPFRAQYLSGSYADLGEWRGTRGAKLVRVSISVIPYDSSDISARILGKLSDDEKDVDERVLACFDWPSPLPALCAYAMAKDITIPDGIKVFKMQVRARFPGAQPGTVNRYSYILDIP